MTVACDACIVYFDTNIYLTCSVSIAFRPCQLLGVQELKITDANLTGLLNPSPSKPELTNPTSALRDARSWRKSSSDACGSFAIGSKGSRR